MKRMHQWLWAALVPMALVVSGCPGMTKAIGEAKNREKLFLEARQAGDLDKSLGFYHPALFADPSAGGKEGWKKQMEAAEQIYGKPKSWTYYTEFNYQDKVGTGEKFPGKQVSLKLDVVCEKSATVEEMTWYKPNDGSSDWVIIGHKWTPKNAPTSQP